MGFNSSIQVLLRPFIGGGGGGGSNGGGATTTKQTSSKHHHPDDELLPPAIYVDVDEGFLELEVADEEKQQLHSTKLVATDINTIMTVDFEDDDEDESSNNNSIDSQPQHEPTAPAALCAATGIEADTRTTTTSTTTSTINNDSKHNKKSTNKFVKLRDGDVVVHDVLHLNDYTDEERHSTWYNQLELSLIRTSNKAIIDMVGSELSKQQQQQQRTRSSRAQHQPVEDDSTDDDEEEDCIRGLELQTKSIGSKLRRRLRDTSKQVVLNEQLDQHKRKVKDELKIAELYKLSCERSLFISQTLGKKDELIAMQIHSSNLHANQ